MWQRGQMLGLMGGAIAGLVAYMLYLLRRLDSQLDDAATEAPPDLATAPVPAPSKSAPGLMATPNR